MQNTATRVLTCTACLAFALVTATAVGAKRTAPAASDMPVNDDFRFGVQYAVGGTGGGGCTGDTNGDNVVDVNDLNNIILDWSTDGSANGGDVTGPIPGSPPDGIVDVNDLNAVIVQWGSCI